MYRTTPYIPPQQTKENNKSKCREDIKIVYSLTLISIPHVLLDVAFHEKFLIPRMIVCRTIIRIISRGRIIIGLKPIIKKNKREPTFMGPLQVWPMVYIGTALRGALYSLSYLLFVVCM